MAMPFDSLGPSRIIQSNGNTEKNLVPIWVANLPRVLFPSSAILLGFTAVVTVDADW